MGWMPTGSSSTRDCNKADPATKVRADCRQNKRVHSNFSDKMTIDKCPHSAKYMLGGSFNPSFV
eukprot:scaffold111948_cov41-Prasinocladus_malaysianus.AAC.1